MRHEGFEPCQWQPGTAPSRARRRTPGTSGFGSNPVPRILTASILASREYRTDRIRSLPVAAREAERSEASRNVWVRFESCPAHASPSTVARRSIATEGFESDESQPGSAPSSARRRMPGTSRRGSNPVPRIPSRASASRVYAPRRIRALQVAACEGERSEPSEWRTGSGVTPEPAQSPERSERSEQDRLGSVRILSRACFSEHGREEKHRDGRIRLGQVTIPTRHLGRCVTPSSPWERSIRPGHRIDEPGRSARYVRKLPDRESG